MLWIIILTLAGVVLIAAEVYLPGMILGILGGVALLIAVAMGFGEFGLAGGALFSVLLFCVVCVGVMFGLKLFPRSPIGRRMMLSSSLVGGSGQLGASELVGVEGRAVTMLRPSGVATFNGHRYDVVAETGLVAGGTAVRVLSVEGSKIIVTPVAET